MGRFNLLVSSTILVCLCWFLERGLGHSPTYPNGKAIGEDAAEHCKNLGFGETAEEYERLSCHVRCGATLTTQWFSLDDEVCKPPPGPIISSDRNLLVVSTQPKRQQQRAGKPGGRVWVDRNRTCVFGTCIDSSLVYKVKKSEYLAAKFTVGQARVKYPSESYPCQVTIRLIGYANKQALQPFQPGTVLCRFQTNVEGDVCSFSDEACLTFPLHRRSILEISLQNDIDATVGDNSPGRPTGTLPNTEQRDVFRLDKHYGGGMVPIEFGGEFGSGFSLSFQVDPDPRRRAEEDYVDHDDYEFIDDDYGDDDDE